MTTAIAPAVLLRGPGVVAALGGRVAAYGARPFVVHGEHGFALVAPAIRASLAAAGLAAAEVAHLGHVTDDALARLAARVAQGGHDVVVGAGGGRVLDAAKGAAHLGRVPFVAVPTSPATCAATTALSIVYDADGVWRGPFAAARCADLAVVDGELLGAAPDRLLAAGVADAWCKVVEVRRAARRTVSESGPDTLLGAALALCDELARLVEPATGALAEGLPTDPATRAALAEACVVLPGLIGGLAGEGNKLAAAHAVHNALTRVPGHHDALHGELIAFGILVQRALEGSGDDELAAVARWFARLGIDPSLAALGCAAYDDDPEPVLAWLLQAPALIRSFPTATRSGLASTFARVDAVCGDVGR